MTPSNMHMYPFLVPRLQLFEKYYRIYIETKNNKRKLYHI